MDPMTNRCLSGRTAIFIMALCALAGSSACDVPIEVSESMESAETDAELIAGAADPADPADQADLQAVPSTESPILDEVYIESITTNGKGCPAADPHTVSVVIAGDKKSFVIIYNDMELINPPGPKVKNLSCTAAIKLHIPQGLQISLATVNTAGYLYLDDDIKAKETSSYSFAGGNVGMYSSSIVGPYDDLYVFTDKIPFVSQVWSKCGGSVIFIIKTTLNLNAKDNPGGQAIFSTDTTDGKFQKVLGWVGKSC